MTTEKSHNKGENNPTGRPLNKKGRIKIKNGYIKVRVLPGEPFYPMVEKTNYVYEHRLVMAKHLGRCLEPEEFVHHKNGVRDDNRLENLQCTSNKEHSQIGIKRIRELEHRVRELEDYIEVLKKGENV